MVASPASGSSPMIGLPRARRPAAGFGTGADEDDPVRLLPDREINCVVAGIDEPGREAFGQARAPLPGPFHVHILSCRSHFVYDAEGGGKRFCNMPVGGCGAARCGCRWCARAPRKARTSPQVRSVSASRTTCSAQYAFTATLLPKAALSRPGSIAGRKSRRTNCSCNVSCRTSVRSRSTTITRCLGPDASPEDGPASPEAAEWGKLSSCKMTLEKWAGTDTRCLIWYKTGGASRQV